MAFQEARERALHECLICFEKVDEKGKLPEIGVKNGDNRMQKVIGVSGKQMTRVNDCEHSYCIECILGYIKTKVNNGFS